MFGRIILTQLKMGLRSKKYMFWTLAFPLILGTLFSFAFKTIYDSERSSPIPVVVEVEASAIDEYEKLMTFSALDTDKISDDFTEYEKDKAVAEAMGESFTEEAPISEDTLNSLEEIDSFDKVTDFDISLIPSEYLKEEINISEDDLPFISLLDELEYEDGTEMIERVAVGSHDEAMQLLEDGDIAGIITVADLKDVSLLVNGEGTNHSILSSIISQYRLNVDLTIDSMNAETTEPEDIAAGVDEGISSIEFIDAKGTSGDNKDPFVSYFYNLIAMICLMGSIASLSSIVSNQANQSTTGIRLDSSPANKIIYEMAQLIAIFIIQAAIIVITLCYLIFIQRIRFGGDIGMVYLTAILSSLTGIILGYFVAHLGKADASKKESLLMVIVLGGGFLAGLMMGDMKIIIEENAPIINRINPAAVITDAFYALNVFGVGDRYYSRMGYLLGLSMVMLIAGIILSRRNSYKSL